MTAANAVTLPAPSPNAIVGVFNASSLEIGVKQHASETISGAFVKNASLVPISPNQCVVLQANGTNWRIVALTPTITQENKSAEQTFFSWGEIAVTGGSPSRVGGTGDFTISKVEAQVYKIVWDKEKGSQYYSCIFNVAKPTVQIGWYIKEQTAEYVVLHCAEEPTVITFQASAAS